MPEVSVVMPAYNAARYIGRTIESLLHQTFADFELIVVDDGSTDETRAVVQGFASDKLRYVSQPNQGVSCARNTGLAMSRTEYVVFLDADDWWEDCFIELLVQALRENPACAVAHCDWAYADATGWVGVRRSSYFSKGVGLRTLLLLNPLRDGLVKREAVQAVGGFRTCTPILEDWDLWIRLAAAGYQYVHVPQLLAYYNWHPNSTSKDADARKADRLSALDSFWTHNPSAADYAALKSRSYATAYIDFCVARLCAGDIRSALAELDVAGSFDEQILTEVDTYYRMVFADQSASTGSRIEWIERIDDASAHRNIEAVVSHLRRKQAQATAYYALGLAYYNEHNLPSARRYFVKALRTHWRPALQQPQLATLCKSLVPADAQRIVRQWKGMAHGGSHRG